jgi:hypothetical protein
MKPARLILENGQIVEIDLDAEFTKISYRPLGQADAKSVKVARLDLGTPFLDCDLNRIYENDQIEGYPAGPIRMGEKTGQWEAPYTTDKDGNTIYGAIPGEIGQPSDPKLPRRTTPPFMLNIRLAKGGEK